jgi:hypothetical protein
VLLIAGQPDYLDPLACASTCSDALADGALARPIVPGKCFIHYRRAGIVEIGLLRLEGTTREKGHADGVEVARRRDHLQHDWVIIVGAKWRIPLGFPKVAPMPAQWRRRRGSHGLNTWHCAQPIH